MAIPQARTVLGDGLTEPISVKRSGKIINLLVPVLDVVT
jgi:hypothetical protein